MELNQLRGFYEIAREHSFTRAADKLFLTQPAISLQVKALEEELGEMLFERTRKNIRMTPAGARDYLLRRGGGPWAPRCRRRQQGQWQVLRRGWAS